MPSSQWVFDRFRLDPDHACLWCDAEALVLPPKTFAVLHYLVTHPDRLVSKDELLGAVWPKTAVTDAVLRVAIGALRKVLGDLAQTPRFIATVSRRGYRFLAPVEEHTSVASVPVPSAAGPVPPAVPQLPETLPPPEAERRPLTVLCCDLVDASWLARHLDPEDLRELVRAYHQTCAEVIHRFDGYVAQYLGDGMVVYFGYPMAHEDDAQRAVWTGLGLLQALAPLTAPRVLPRGEHLAVRLGVHTGLVVIGAVGAGARHEPLALGETPTIAARVQALAAPNTLLISTATYQRIAGYFTCEAFGDQPLRGRAHPLRVYRVLRPSGVQSRLEVAITSGLTPLVGRGSEVEILRERWARVKAGMGQVVVLAGEAGIGKSRLVHVLKDHIAHEAHLCWECRGVPYYQHTVLYPLTALLQRWLQWRPGAAPAAPIEQLEALLTQAQLALDDTVPLLADLVALPLPAERYPPRPLPPEQQRQRTLEVLLALVGGLAEQQPVLVIVEDLHWVDPSTREFLGLLIDQVPTARIYTVLTCRPEFQAPWSFRTHLTPLALNRLTLSQAEAMIKEMRGGQYLPAAVLAQIVAKTDGIPLFVEEVTKAVLEARRGTAVSEPDAAPGAGPALAIPVTLHEALLARLDRLGSAKGVAQLGATIGREFAYALLQAVAHLEDEALQRDLATLVAAELLYQRGQPPRATYTFKHALIQEAAYESVLQRVRQHTHQRIVQVLEAQFPETAATTPELLAHHALRGERWDQAVTYFRQAGEQAIARSAYREGVAAFEQALIALQHLPDSRDTREQAIDLRLALHTALFPSGDSGRILAALWEAEALAAALDDSRRLGWISVHMATHLRDMGAYDQAIAAAQRALGLAMVRGDVVLQALANQYLGGAYHVQGDYRRAIDCFRQTVAALDGTRRHERFGQAFLPSVNSRARLAACHAELGLFAEGSALGEEGLRIAEAVDHPGSLMFASWWVGLLCLRQGDLPQALSLLEQAMGICQAADFPTFFSLTAAALGAVYTLAGRLAEAMPWLTRALEQATTTERVESQVFCRLSLGEAQVLAGHLEEAQALAEQALRLARGRQERGNEAWTLRLLGEIHAHGDAPQVAPATDYYRQALALAEKLGMRPLQAHCHLGLGILSAKTGQREQARAALSTAIEMYRAMEMTFWLPQTEAALAQG